MDKVTGYVTGVNGNLVSASFSGSVSIHLHQSQEVDTEYACGDYRSKYWVQTRYFLVNRPHFKQFFLLSV